MYLNRLQALARIVKQGGHSTHKDRQELATLRRIDERLKVEHAIAKIESVPAVLRFGREVLELMEIEKRVAAAAQLEAGGGEA